MPGYSGTPLAKKLGIKPGHRVYVVGFRDDYEALTAPLPEDVRLLQRAGKDLDVVHAFVDRRAKLERGIEGWLARIRRDGMIWISWPKKASKVPTDMTEDVVREVALPLGLVDIKVCAVDDTWSGLKLVLRKELR